MFFNYRVLLCPQNEHTVGLKKAKTPPPLGITAFIGAKYEKLLRKKISRFQGGGRGFRLFEPPSVLVLRTKKDAVIIKNTATVSVIWRPVVGSSW